MCLGACLCVQDLPVCRRSAVRDALRHLLFVMCPTFMSSFPFSPHPFVLGSFHLSLSIFHPCLVEQNRNASLSRCSLVPRCRLLREEEFRHGGENVTNGGRDYVCFLVLLTNWGADDTDRIFVCGHSGILQASMNNIAYHTCLCSLQIPRSREEQP